MFSNFSPRPVMLLPLCLFASIACKKGSSPSLGSGSDNPVPAITAVGTPVGSPVTKNVDASGGSLASPDGKLVLSIPAGALSASTAISIQPVTNTAPGGIGSAYQLLPEGTKFNKAVTITFHYTDSDANGSLPYFLYIAYQDSANAWEADLKQRNLDTVAKTVSITSTHFSIWSAFVDIDLTSGQDVYHESEGSYFEVREILKHGTKQADGSGGDDDLYSLPIAANLPDDVVSNWSLNGSGPNTLAFGNITGSGAHVTYKAPAIIDNKSTVQVSVEVKFKETIFSYSSGKQVASFNKLILYHSIDLIPNALDYTLTMEIGDSQLSSSTDTYGYHYSDHAIMDLTIDPNVIGYNVSVSNIQNFPPDYSFTSGTTCNMVSVYPDPIGELNIVSGRGWQIFVMAIHLM